MNPRTLARRLRLGPWWLKHYHQRFPRLNWLGQFGVAGGARYALGERAMRRAALRLPPIAAGDARGFACWFMTGAGYWNQTLFCAHSLATAVQAPLRVTVLDDGTLTEAQKDALLRVLRGAQIVTRQMAEAALERRFPRERFPRLLGLRDQMPMLRKLVDLRAGSSGWQLYLDSDMLFFRRPDFLLECAQRGTPCHMVDRLFAYCLPTPQLTQISGGIVPERVNAGIVGLDSAMIDWEMVESWLMAMPDSALDPRLLEQSLTAMLLGRFDARPAPESDYHIVYDSTSRGSLSPVVLHYIFHAKLRYFSSDWRAYFRGITSSAAQA